MALSWDIRRDELRAVVLSCATLAALLASHALLETARDALFLERLPPSRLPWVYVAIAAVGVGAARLGTTRRITTRWLAAALGVASAVTAGFWLLTSGTATWILYALYIWSGAYATLIVVQFWGLLGSFHAITEAKRVFGLVGVGGIVGAIAGFAVAKPLAEGLGTRSLVLAAAVVMAATVPLPLLLGRIARPRAPRRDAVRSPPSFGKALAYVGGHPYARRVAALVLLASMTFTLLDFVFKIVVTRSVPAPDLASFFATLHAVLNVAALLVQVALVPWLLRSNLHWPLALLPLFLLGGGVALAAGGGLVAALALKGADGALRHSLQRTVSELLFVPMSERLRAAAKQLIDIVGQRGGQAIASLAILGGLAVFGNSVTVFSLASVVAAAAWLAVGFAVRPSYFELFRRALAEDSAVPLDVSELDIASLETLIDKLSSESDDEVVAVIELLAHRNRLRLVPDLILYHPSPLVVARALALFASESRASSLPIVRRLLRSGDPSIRVAALQNCRLAVQDQPLLRRALDDPSPAVSATAWVSLVAADTLPASEAGAVLAGIRDRGEECADLALARAIALNPLPAFAAIVTDLAASTSAEVRSAAADAASRIPAPQLIPILVRMLGERAQRAAGRTGLLSFGDEALDALAGALADPAISAVVRRHIPLAIAGFRSPRAFALLFARLHDESNEAMRDDILRALGSALGGVQEPDIDVERVDALIDASLRDGFRMLSLRVALVAGAAEEPTLDTELHALMTDLLRDCEQRAIWRVFRLLGLVFPREDVGGMYRGLQHGGQHRQSSARELLSGLLDRRYRRQLLSLIAEDDDARRLEGAAPLYDATPPSYRDALRDILAHDGEPTLWSVAQRRVVELGPLVRAQEEGTDAA